MIDATYCQESLLFKDGKERLTFFRKCIRSRQPFFLRARDKTEALLLAFGEKFFDGRRRPLTDLDDRRHPRGWLAARALGWIRLYRLISRNGNPRLSSLDAVLTALGLKVTFSAV